MSDIFISYKREDQAVAKNLAELLENSGWTVWWDPQLRAGEHFDDVIEHQLGHAKCVIVIWSHQSIRSQYVKDEATYALKLKKLIPVAIEKTSPPFRFQGLHTLFLSDWRNLANSPDFQKLLTDIQHLTNVFTSPKETVKKPAKSSIYKKLTQEASQFTIDEEDNSDTSILGATAIYGESFKKTQASDIFTLKIYVNLFATAKDADNRVKKEIHQFIKRQDYDSYIIIKRQHNFFRGYYEYTIQFK